MTADAWLPIGYRLSDGRGLGAVIHADLHWQITALPGYGQALLADDTLHRQWVAAGLVQPGQFQAFAFGDRKLHAMTCKSGQMLFPVCTGTVLEGMPEALSLATALSETRRIDALIPLHDAIFVERISRMLPTYTVSAPVGDDVLLGYVLTGGRPISATSFRRLHQAAMGLSRSQLKRVVETAGFPVSEIIATEAFVAPAVAEQALQADGSAPGNLGLKAKFELPGRPEITAFFNEHIIDIVENLPRYAAMGVGFPTPVVLEGPPGCGKTHAAERLVDYLGWPSYSIQSSSVASPYIHETSRKIAEVFDTAIANAPAIVIVDEMDAWVADRDMDGGQHRIEEVAEFLRRIPEAAKHNVLIIGMTNKIDLIDPAILRRGRFDYILKVDFASELEVLMLLKHLLSELPTAGDVDAVPIAAALAGRPLSDVSFVIREAARRAARDDQTAIGQRYLLAALDDTQARSREGEAPRRIGYY